MLLRFLKWVKKDVEEKILTTLLSNKNKVAINFLRGTIIYFEFLYLIFKIEFLYFKFVYSNHIKIILQLTYNTSTKRKLNH